MKEINFNSIIGNKIAVSMLENIIANNNIAPAYLFTGILGIGKFTTSMIFARHLVKSDIEMQVIQGSLMDKIKIEQIHEVEKFVSIKPAIGKRKVVIINAEANLSDKCGNALLKVLEEPPPKVTIIIVSSSEVLPTIRSRCHVIDFLPLTKSEIMLVLSKLGHEHINESIIHAASGSVGKTLQIIKAWENVSALIKELSTPPTTVSQALRYSNNIALLDYENQILILQLLAAIWWKKHDTKLLQKATTAMSYLKSKVSARTVWDNLLIP